MELGGAIGAGVRKWATVGASSDDAVHEGQGFLVERDHPLGVQLAERDLEPSTIAGDLVHVVQLEVEQLTHTQTARPLQE